MRDLDRPLILPVAVTVISFIALTVMAVSVNPLDNAAYVIVFLLILFMFFTGAGHLWLSHQKGIVTPKDRSRILLLSFTVVAIVMLRSLQALGGMEALLIFILALVLFFYIGRTRS